MTSNHDDFVPVTRGRGLADDAVRVDTCALQDSAVTPELDRHLLRILTLHPELQVKFRCQDLQALDDATKQAFLTEINDALGIQQLRK